MLRKTAAKSNMAPVRTLSIYLLRPDVTGPGDALRPDLDGLTEHTFTAGTGEGDSLLYVAPTEEREPDWVGLLRPATEPPVQARSQSASAVLVLPAAGRWFAITFGYGRTLLDSARYERRFGLKVALNAIDPSLLRGAQARTFNDHALHTQRQVSKLSRIEALELDVERDLVVALGGTLTDVQLGRRIDGRHAARLTAELDAGMLAAKCAELLAESRKTRYRADFPWIDTIEEVIDPAEIAELESRAAELLGRRSFSKFDLDPPELVGQEIVSFRVWPSHGGLVVIEPDANLLGVAVNIPMDGPAARTAVEHHKLVALDTQGDEVARWSFWDCLHLELVISGRRVVLDDGRWYRIEQSFADDVDAFAAGLSASGLALPPADRDEKEGDYNARAAQNAGYALLDQKTITLPGRTAIEACDLFGPGGELVHVKRRKGGSGPLSHLIGQAAVSAGLLLNEHEFRDALRDRLAVACPGFERLVEEPARAPKHPIVLALITNAAATGRVAAELPFFTKVFLRHSVRPLINMGFAVHVDEIAVAPPQVSALPPRPTRRRRKPATPRPGPRRVG
ncbi:MAG: hypothetical protein QOH12_814 [Solirubrobacteraceae bacterium]|nr:hypothetical protein [Solirubrobacteraceae bacterium]